LTLINILPLVNITTHGQTYSGIDAIQQAWLHTWINCSQFLLVNVMTTGD